MKYRILASAVVASALVCGSVQAQQSVDPIRSDFIQMLWATDAAFEAQSAFNLARAANDTEAAKDAAAMLLVATGEAAFWSKVLQLQVTADNTSEQMVSNVAELNELSVRAFNALAPVVLEGDMAALDNTLDQSADALTGLVGVMNRMMLLMGSN